MKHTLSPSYTGVVNTDTTARGWDERKKRECGKILTSSNTFESGGARGRQVEKREIFHPTVTEKKQNLVALASPGNQAAGTKTHDRNKNVRASGLASRQRIKRQAKLRTKKYVRLFFTYF